MTRGLADTLWFSSDIGHRLQLAVEVEIQQAAAAVAICTAIKSVSGHSVLAERAFGLRATTPPLGQLKKKIRHNSQGNDQEQVFPFVKCRLSCRLRCKFELQATKHAHEERPANQVLQVQSSLQLTRRRAYTMSCDNWPPIKGLITSPLPYKPRGNSSFLLQRRF